MQQGNNSWIEWNGEPIIVPKAPMHTLMVTQMLLILVSVEIHNLFKVIVIKLDLNTLHIAKFWKYKCSSIICDVSFHWKHFPFHHNVGAFDGYGSSILPQLITQGFRITSNICPSGYYFRDHLSLQ